MIMLIAITMTITTTTSDGDDDGESNTILFVYIHDLWLVYKTTTPSLLSNNYAIIKITLCVY